MQTAEYGIAVSKETNGFAANVDASLTLAQAGVGDGDVLVFGRVQRDKLDLSSADSVFVNVDEKYASTKWASDEWTPKRDDAGAMVFATVDYKAAGIVKNCRWLATQTVNDALVDFCDKVGAAPASSCVASSPCRPASSHLTSCLCLAPST